MAKFDDNEINKFIENLESVDETWQSEYNLKEVIKKAYSLIEKARKYKVSWEQIAKLLEDSCDDNIQINSITIRQYFLEISKNHKKSKRRSKSSKNTDKNQDKKLLEAREDASSKIKNSTTESNTFNNSEDANKENKRVIPSAFNLRND